MKILFNIRKRIGAIYSTYLFVYNELRELICKKKNIDESENSYSDFLLKVKEKYPFSSKSSNILLVPLIDDIGTMKIIAQYAYKIASEEKLQIKYFYVHTSIDQPIERSRIRAYVKFLKINYFTGVERLKKIYKIHKEDILISNLFLPSTRSKPIERILNKEELVEMKDRDIVIGDIIYDTYLRFRSKPTVDLSNDCLYDIINYTKKLNSRWQKLFLNHSIVKILLPYTAYIHWGIPARSALKNNVDVITFGSNIYILNQISKEHPFHTKNHHKYKPLFKVIDSKKAKLTIAKNKLEERLSGGIDLGISYMKNSAFHNFNDEEFNIEKDKRTAIIFLHCFFDSPHIYDGCLFPDFHDWILFILEVASKNHRVNYYIKPHPNGLEANYLIIEDLKVRYKSFSNIRFLSQKISNKQIIDQRPDAVFTLYGTVAHEFAYCGFPVITAGDNPHSGYDFLYNSSSTKELYNFLVTVGEYGLPAGYNKNEILEFFYMHYLYYSERFTGNDFDLVKNFQTGEVSIPDGASINDLLFFNNSKLLT